MGQDVAVLVTGLGGEAHDDQPRPGRVLHEPRQDVGVLHQGDHRRGLLGRALPAALRDVTAGQGVLLDLGRLGPGGPVVGHGGGHDHGVGLRGGLADRRLHLHGGTHLPDADLRGQVGQDILAHVGGHQGDPGPCAGCGGGQGHPLAPAGAVAQEAYRVQGLARASRGDDDVAPPEVPSPLGVGVTPGRPPEEVEGLGHDVLGLGQAPHAGVGAGQGPAGGVNDPQAATAQGGDVVHGGRVEPHLGVHGRGQDHRGGRGQDGGGEQVVGPPRRQAGQEVGAGRGDQDQLGPLADRHVLHGLGVVEEAGGHRVGAHGRQGGGPDEPQGRRGGDDPDLVTGPAQQAHQGRGLVGRDRAGHAQDHVPPPSLAGTRLRAPGARLRTGRHRG